MTTTPTTTCPAWCTFDHEASARHYRQRSAEMAAAGDIPNEPESWEQDIEVTRLDHSHRVGKHVDIVSDSQNPQPRIMVFVESNDETKSAGQARALAADLLAAADHLDAIEAV